MLGSLGVAYVISRIASGNNRMLVKKSVNICCVNNVITPIPLPLFPPARSTVPLSRNRGSATRIGGKHKDKVLYRGIGGV